jgi:hypothetical protein
MAWIVDSYFKIFIGSLVFNSILLDIHPKSFLIIAILQIPHLGQLLFFF